MDALEQLQKIDRTREIGGWKVRMYFMTRSPQVLWSAAIVILGIGLCIAWLIAPKGIPLRRFKAKGISVSDELAKPHPDIETIIKRLHRTRGLDVDPDTFPGQVAASALDGQDKMVLLAYAGSLQTRTDEPTADLLYYAHYIKPLPHANELAGDLYQTGTRYDKAAVYYQREADLFHSQDAQAKLLELRLDQKDLPAAQKLAENRDLFGSLPLKDRLDALAKLHRWSEFATPLLAWEKSLFQPIPLTVALVAGLAWFAIALQAIQPSSVAGFRAIVSILAVASGMASTLFTLFAVYWQQEMMGLRQSGGLGNDLIFFLLGVGPREELIKLLFFLPFVPVLLVRKQPLEMLMVAGCVGLGFAVNENLLYFAQAGPEVASGRFLTANFFHLSLTALSGLALCEMLMQPVKKTLPFLGILACLILAHGFYDALMPVVIGRFSVSMIIFVVVALFFFRRLAVLRDSATDQFSMAATLVLGVSILGAVVLVAAAMQLGFQLATMCLVSSSIGLLMAVMIFYFQLTEGMQYPQSSKEGPIYS